MLSNGGSWTKNDLIVGGVRLHYYRTGHGEKPPLVLAHGFSDSGLCWSRTARDLEAEYDVVMPDMRGHGLSERMRPGDEVDMAADLAGLIRGLGLHRPIVCGHSMGAMVTYELGLRFPELADALVLEDPPWWVGRPPEPHGLPIGEWAKALGGKTLEELLAQYRMEQPDWPEELVRLMVESKKQLDPAIIDTLVGKVDRVAMDWQTTLQDMAVPMLLVTGNPELGGIVTPEVEARVRQLNPSVTIVNVPNVGHLIRYDNYAAFMAALRAFLEQVPRDSSARPS
jgi:N-formylmaleamate deformylase